MPNPGPEPGGRPAAAAKRLRRGRATPPAPRRGWRRAAAACATLVSCLAVGTPHAARAAGTVEPGARRPHIVLVTIDALRADHVSALGYPRPTTPNLAALAARGATFEQALANGGWTLPGIASLLTGTTPPVHRVEGPDAHMPGGLTPLPAWLAERGYRAPGFFPWYVERGFGFEPVDARFQMPYAGDPAKKTDTALAWLDAHPEPAFLWVHYVSVHLPYEPTPESRARFDRGFSLPDGFAPDRAGARALAAGTVALGADARQAIVDRYDGCVADADRELGRLVAGLERRGLLERTILVVTADHGDELLDRGQLGHAFWTYRGGLHEEILRIPLVLAGPGIAHERVAEPVQQIDLAPTLLALLGLAAPPWIEGRSLLGPRDGERPAFAESTPAGFYAEPDVMGPAWVRSVRRPPWKLIVATGALDVGRSLYRLDEDPGELDDRAAREPERVQALVADLEEWLLDARRRALELRRGGLRAGALEPLGVAVGDPRWLRPTAARSPSSAGPAAPSGLAARGSMSSTGSGCHEARPARSTQMRSPRRWVVVAALLALATPAAAQAPGSRLGVLDLAHRMALDGDGEGLERLLKGQSVGGVVDPLRRGHILASMGRLDEAAAEYGRALEAAGPSAELLFPFADLDLRRGDAEAAWRHLGAIWKGDALPVLKAEALRRQIHLAGPELAARSPELARGIGSIGDPDLAHRLLVQLVERADEAGVLFVLERDLAALVGTTDVGPGQAIVLAEIARRTADHRRVRVMLEEARAHSGDPALLNAMEGWVALAEGRAGEAAAAFTRSLATAPGWLAARASRAQALRASGDLASATDDLESIMASATDRDAVDRARLMAIDVAVTRHDLSRVVRLYLEGVTRRGPEVRRRLLEQLFDRVSDADLVAVVRRTRAADRTQEGERLRLEAELDLRAERWRDAARTLERAIVTIPEDPDLVEQLGHVYRRQGELKSAARHYRRWVDLEPLEVRASLALVDVLSRLSGPAGALEAARLQAEQNPRDALAWHHAGTVLSLTGYADEGLAALEQAHALAPQNPEVVLDLATALGNGARRDEGLAMLEELLARGVGGRPWDRGRVLDRLHDLLEASPGTFDRRVATWHARRDLVDPGELDVRLAVHLMTRGESDTALVWLDRTLARSDLPAEVVAIGRDLARRASQQDRAGVAVAVLERLVPVAHGDADARVALELGAAQAAAGDTAAAARTWLACATRHASDVGGARCRLRRTTQLAEQGAAHDEVERELLSLLARPERDLGTTRAALRLLRSSAKEESS